MTQNCLCDKLLGLFFLSEQQLNSSEQPVYNGREMFKKNVTFCFNFKLIICDYVLKRQTCTPF